jgi:hypothetical protein
MCARLREAGFANLHVNGLGGKRAPACRASKATYTERDAVIHAANDGATAKTVVGTAAMPHKVRMDGCNLYLYTVAY